MVEDGRTAMSSGAVSSDGAEEIYGTPRKKWRILDQGVTEQFLAILRQEKDQFTAEDDQ